MTHLPQRLKFSLPRWKERRYLRDTPVGWGFQNQGAHLGQGGRGEEVQKDHDQGSVTAHEMSAGTISESHPMRITCMIAGLRGLCYSF